MCESSEGGQASPNLLIVGLNILRPEELPQSILAQLRRADYVLTPSPTVTELLRAAGAPGAVEIAGEGLPAVTRGELAVYCSLGAPASSDRWAHRLRREAFERGLQVEVREAQPLAWRLRRQLGEAWPVCGDDPGLRSVGPVELATGLCGGETLWVEALYTDEDVALAAESLRRQYPPSHRIGAMAAWGEGAGGMDELALKDMEEEVEAGGRIVLCVPSLALPPEARRDLVPAGQAAAGTWGVVHRLRAPGGCPWDREQDHRSLRPFLLEECHELAAALQREDVAEVREELGDVLLQVILHAVIARERDSFSAADVMMTLVHKMTERHPHVFGDLTVGSADDVETNWEKIKSKRADGTGGSNLDGIPPTLPALLQAEKMQSVASRMGFDWDDVRGPADKIDEEAREFARAVRDEQEAVTGEELGDLLFSLVNAARHLGLSAETELLGSVEKFRRRFRAIEREADRRGTDLDDMTLEEMDGIWEDQKCGK